MGKRGPSMRKPLQGVVLPEGPDAGSHYLRFPWRSSIGISVIGLGAVIVVLSLVFYAIEPSEWRNDLIMGAFGALLIAIVFVASWLMTPRLPPRKD